MTSTTLSYISPSSPSAVPCPFTPCPSTSGGSAALLLTANPAPNPHPGLAGTTQVQQTYNPGFFALSLADVTGNEDGKTDPANTVAGLLICNPEVMNVVPIYRPTLKFVTKVLAIIGSTGESALTRGTWVGGYEVGSGENPEGLFPPLSPLLCIQRPYSVPQDAGCHTHHSVSPTELVLTSSISRLTRGSTQP